MTAVLQQEMHQKAVPKKAVRELKHLHTAGRNKVANLLGCGWGDCCCVTCCCCHCSCWFLPPDP
jgi:hypothetical protein